MLPGTHFYQPIAPGLEICAFSGFTQRFPKHFHNHYLVGCILSGTRMMYVAGEKRPFQTGEIVLLNPGEAHGCEQSGTEDPDWLGLHFSSNFLLHATRQSASSGYPFFASRWARDKYLEKILRIIFTSIPMVDIGRTNGLIRLIISYLIQTNRIVFCEPQFNPANHSDLEDLCWHLRNNLAENSSLKKMCKLAKMDKFGLVRQFSNRYGITPWSYLESLRVNHGCQLLAAGSKIADVAFSCGFADQSHFSRAFKARIGLAPSQFKKAVGASLEKTTQLLRGCRNEA